MRFLFWWQWGGIEGNATATPSTIGGTFTLPSISASGQQNLTTEATVHALTVSAPNAVVLIGAIAQAVAHVLTLAVPDAVVSVTSNASAARSSLIITASLPRPTITAEGGVSNTLPGAIRIEIGLGL